jgi:hypothetical protein
MVAAAATLQAGDLDEAVSMAEQAIDLAGPLDSARYRRYLTDFHADLARQHGNDQRVRGFTAALREGYPELNLLPLAKLPR